MPSFGTNALIAMIGIWMIDFYERLGADLATLTFFIVSVCVNVYRESESNHLQLGFSYWNVGTSFPVQL